MSSLRVRLNEQMPTLILVNLAVSGTFCVYAATRFLSLPFSPALALLCAAIIFGIYALNRITDRAEDFSNDTGRTVLTVRGSGIAVLGVAGLAASFAYLLLRGHLTLYHLVLLGAGIAYSVPSIPWYSSGSFRFIKMKQIPLLKNLSVAVLWSVSIFLIPIIYSRTTPPLNLQFALVFASIALATFSNTTFNDIRDEKGDRLAGNATLPVIWGAGATLALILGTNALWIAGVAALVVFEIITVRLAVFLMVMAAFTLVYVLAYYRKWVPGRAVEMISDMHFAAFATGLLLTL